MQKGGIKKVPPFFGPKFVKRIFLIVDIISFLVQCMGGGNNHVTMHHSYSFVGLTATNQEMAEVGSRIILFGLALSLSVFVFFLFLCIYLHITILRQKPVEGSTPQDEKWRKIFYVLYMDMILLTVRSIYRVAEFANPTFHNKISLNEGMFYGLDIVLMLAILVLWIPFHPGFWDMVDNEDIKEATPEPITV
jgi:hypothetical protein